MNKFKTDPAITILILTAFSYGVTFLYQLSYKSYYNLPEMFIELNINTITPLLVFVFLLVLIILGIWHNLKGYVIFTKELLPLFPSTFSTNKFIKFIQFIVQVMINAYKTLLDVMGQLFPIFLLMSLMSMGAMLAGEFRASIKKEYMVIKQKDGLYIEVSSYKDLIVIAPLDLKKESMAPKFKTIEMKELKDAEMIRFENGLKVENVKKSKDLNEYILSFKCP